MSVQGVEHESEVGHIASPRAAALRPITLDLQLQGSIAGVTCPSCSLSQASPSLPPFPLPPALRQKASLHLRFGSVRAAFFLTPIGHAKPTGISA